MRPAGPAPADRPAQGVEHADTPYLIRLFGADAERPRRRSAANQCDENKPWSHTSKERERARLSRNLIQ